MTVTFKLHELHDSLHRFAMRDFRTAHARQE